MPPDVAVARLMESHAERVERFRAVYDEMYPRVMAFALRRARSREDALDAVSETFVVVWRRLEDLPADGAQSAWVYGVARRVLANQYRAQNRASGLIGKLRGNQSGVVAPPSSDNLVHEALDRLRRSDRELLTMVAWDDLDNGEIAAVLGISEKNVAVRLHRARGRLAREFGVLGVHKPEKSETLKSSERIRTPNEVNGTTPELGEVETP